MLPENGLIDSIRELLDGKMVFLVGGSVRDILLERELTDYDFMTEDDVFPFASLLGERLGCRVSVNKRLLTSTVHTPWGDADFSRARKEVYAYPGALPSVRLSTWEEDLRRRDFTINTLAVPLLKKGWGEITDLWGGKEDLRNKLIRILHPGSFRDDPTRMLRALRLKSRLGFTLEEETEASLKKEWPMLGRVSAARIFKEWVLLCQEGKPAAILKELYDAGGWQPFWGNAAYDPAVIEELDKAVLPEYPAGFRPWYFYLLLFLSRSPQALEKLPFHGALPAGARLALERTLSLSLNPQSLSGMPLGEVFRRCKELPAEGIYFIYYIFRAGAGRFARYTWEEFYRLVKEYKMPISGRDLLAIGIPPGPGMGQLLAYLDDLYGRGVFDNKDEGLRIAEQYRKKEGKQC